MGFLLQLTGIFWLSFRTSHILPVEGVAQQNVKMLTTENIKTKAEVTWKKKQTNKTMGDKLICSWYRLG